MQHLIVHTWTKHTKLIFRTLQCEGHAVSSVNNLLFGFPIVNAFYFYCQFMMSPRESEKELKVC